MASGSGSGSNGAVAARSSLGGGRMRPPLHVHIATLFSLLIIGVGGVIGWHNYIQNRDLIISASQELVQAIGGKTAAGFEAIYRPVDLLIDLLAYHRLRGATNLADRMESVSYLADALKHSPSLSALYVGYGNGDFFLLRPLRDSPAARAQFRAPADAAYLVQSIERDAGGAPRGA